MSKLLLEHFHGAVTRVGVTDTAFPHRAPGYNFLVLGQWADRKDNDACISSDARFLQRDDAVSDRNRPMSTTSPMMNRKMRSLPPMVQTMNRLRRIKMIYDQENFFHMNQNIRPLA